MPIVGETKEYQAYKTLWPYITKSFKTHHASEASITELDDLKKYNTFEGKLPFGMGESSSNFKIDYKKLRSFIIIDKNKTDQIKSIDFWMILA